MISLEFEPGSYTYLLFIQIQDNHRETYSETCYIEYQSQVNLSDSEAISELDQCEICFDVWCLYASFETMLLI